MLSTFGFESTQEQAQHGYSIGEQKERLLAFCKARDWIALDIYVDGGYSGAKLERPAIQKLITDINKFDLVLVYKLDRLSRSQKDMLFLIEEIFLPNDVDFVSMSESFDTSTPFGRAMIGILSVFAQLEREQIKERTKMGKMARAKKGLFHGGSNYPIGYDYKDGRLVINEYEAAQVRLIFNWYLEGVAVKKIAERLREYGYTTRYGIWSENAGRHSISRMLASEVYLGKIRFGTVVAENAHEAIITPDIFDRVQVLRKRRRETFGNSSFIAKHLLTGLVFCGQCTARYFVMNTGKYKYYSCYSRVNKITYMVKNENCKNKHWQLDELENIVESEVSNLLFDSHYYEQLIQDKAKKNLSPVEDESIFKNKILDLEKQIGKLMDLYQNDSIPANLLADRINKLYREKTALEKQLAMLEPPAPKQDYNIEWTADIIADFAMIWDTTELDERRKILHSLINRIVVNGERVSIEWSFLKND